MDREIIFRGKTNSGNWAYGSLVYSDDIQPAIYFQAGKGQVKEFDWVYVDPVTVGQFTGLYDANRSRIFEGDIVTNDVAVALQEPCLVVFEYGFKLKRGNFYAPLPIAHAFATKVIGNTHDNSELMEVKNVN